MTNNSQVLLKNRPRGVAQASDFKIVRTFARPPEEGEVQVRNAFLSVEPAMRGWIADIGNYSAPVAIGSVMRALACGHVIASRHPDWAVGDSAVGWFGWQEIATVTSDQIVRRIDESDLPLSLSLGVLGINGVTALLALTKIGEPRAGQTVCVSSAAGGVGSAVGQIARLLGCRTVGIAGGQAKTAICVEQFGYDAALDYRRDDFASALEIACPDGVDIYFDNVSGWISDIVMPRLAIGARVVVCGTASIADWTDWPLGPRVERHLLVKRARMQGFVIFDHLAEYAQAVATLAGWVREHRLSYREHILDGIESCPDSLASLYRSDNHGKLLIRL
jgi:NADPH-dependent curcumin reductase CurA